MLVEDIIKQAYGIRDKIDETQNILKEQNKEFRELKEQLSKLGYVYENRQFRKKEMVTAIYFSFTEERNLEMTQTREVSGRLKLTEEQVKQIKGLIKNQPLDLLIDDDSIVEEITDIINSLDFYHKIYVAEIKVENSGKILLFADSDEDDTDIEITDIDIVIEDVDKSLINGLEYSEWVDD